MFKRLAEQISRLLPRPSETDQALAQFRAQRQPLQEEFFRQAAASGKPRGLRWTSCQWQPVLALVDDRAAGLLTAYVGVHVGFEAIPGGDMEDVAAVSDIREGSALFHYQQGRWGTGGRLLFNMPPELAVQRLPPDSQLLQIVQLK